MVSAVVQPVVCPVLIGRGPQLAALEHLIKEAYARHGQVVLVSGEAGIGKSRLISYARERFKAHGQIAGGVEARIFTGHCFEPDRALPYAPLLDLLRHLIEAGHLEELAGALGPAAADLLPVLPELGEHIGTLSAHPTLDPAQQKHRLFQALGRALLRTATPSMLVIEDLHWCDHTSFEFLLYLAQRATAYPLLLLLTYRTDEVHPALRHFLAAVDRERLASEFSLEGLNREEVDALIRAIFPQRNRVRTDFLDVLYTLTEGNPFFLEEVLKSLLASGDIFYMDGRWTRKPLTALAIPRTVQDSVQRRSEQVSPAARRMLNVAAVVGRRFGFALLQYVIGQSQAMPRAQGDSELLASLKELITVQLLVAEPDGRFAFRHALTQQAIYRELLAPERQALHLATGRAIEEQAATAVEAHLSELAYHFYEAGAWEQAFAYSERAGEQARKLYAPGAAVEQFDRAITALAQMGTSATNQRSHKGVVPASLFRARGQAYESLGDFEAAFADYSLALEAARGSGDQRAEWQSLFDLGFLWTGRDFEQAGGHLEAALKMARSLGDKATLAHSLNRVGNWYANIEQQAEGRRRHEEALILFEELADRSGQAATLDLLGISSLMGGNLVASAAYYERAVALFRELHDQQGLALSLGPFSLCGGSYMAPTLAVAPASAGGTSALSMSSAVCRHYAEEAVALLRQTGSRTGEAFALMYMALAMGARGDYAGAWAAAHECVALAGEIEHPVALSGGHFALGALLLDLLDPEAAIQHTRVALDVGRKTGSSFVILSASSFHAQACIARRNYAEAADVLDAESASNARVETVPERLLAGARVELALAQGEPERALALLDALDAGGERNTTGQAVPRLLHWRGQALMKLGDSVQATALLEAAREAADVQESPPLHWRILLDLGRLYKAQGQRGAADACWDAARVVIQGLGRQVPDEGVKAGFLARAGALLPTRAVPSPLQAAKQASDGLTARERDVAVLITQGKTNREIAETLVLSQRTVQVHITNILSKFGFQSRAQIAAWAAARGMTQTGPLVGEQTVPGGRWVERDPRQRRERAHGKI